MENKYIRKYREMRKEKEAKIKEKKEKQLKLHLLEEAGFTCLDEIPWYSEWEFLEKYAFHMGSIYEACAPYVRYDGENIVLVVIPVAIHWQGRRVAWAMRPECTVEELEKALAYVQ